MSFERDDVQIFLIASGSGPVEEIRFERGRGYLALAPDRSLAVYALAAPRIELAAETELAI